MSALSVLAPAADRPSERSFDHHARAITVRHAELLLWMFIGSILALWPTDHLVFADHPELIDGVGRWRTVLIAVNVAGVLASRRLRRAQHLAFPVIALFAVLDAAALGRWLAVASAGEPAWFYASYATPLALMPLLLPLGQRVAITAGVLLACAGGYALDGAATGAAFGSSIATLASVGAMSAAFGHLYYRMVRAEWNQRQALEARVAERAARVRALVGHVERAEDGERRRIGRELHDDLAQLLTALRLEVSAALRHDDGSDRERLYRIDRLTDQLVDAKRRLVAGLRPSSLEQLGFAGAVLAHADQLCTSAGLVLDAQVDADEIEADQPAAVVGYRVVQEALTNVARHASATGVHIDVVSAPSLLHIEIRDDGVGFELADHAEGFGLIGMRERVAAVGGHVDIDTAPGRGTRIAVSLPVE